MLKNQLLLIEKVKKFKKILEVILLLMIMKGLFNMHVERNTQIKIIMNFLQYTFYQNIIKDDYEKN